MSHNYLLLCTVCTVVHYYVLVDYCCFHLTSGSSTAVGPHIVHQTRKRLLLSQSTLQEEFVEKKYQVFDIIGLLLILVQVNLSSPMERILKVVEFWQSANHNIGTASVCRSVQKKIE